MRHFVLVFILSLPALAFADSRVRRIQMSGDQIATVKTAMGIATIIQVPDRPNSVVVGDQEAFKVEYLDCAITIKPLQPHGKSNLYIYTDYKRFNVALVSGAESVSDFVVYLDNPKDQKKDPKPPVVWKTVSQSIKNGHLTFSLSRIGYARSGSLIVEFTISGTDKEQFRPDWLWVTQSGNTRPIQNLFISDAVITPANPIHGSLQLNTAEFNPSLPVRIELRRSTRSFLTLRRIKL